MKLIATAWICDQSPAGAILDVPESDANMLISVGLAKPYEEAPATPEPQPDPQPTIEVKPTPRRRYTRRDLMAED